MESSIATSATQPANVPMVRNAARKLFSFPVFLAVLLMAGAFVGRLGNMQQVSSPGSTPLYWLEGDTWWHIAVGNLILKTHHWPLHDLYSFTAHGSAWIAYEWAGEVLMALAWHFGGARGLMILLTAMAWVVLLLLYYYAYLGSGKVKAAFVACAVLLPLASISFTLRPQMPGYIFLIATLIVLKRFRQGHHNSLWILPPIFLVWVNSHGTFVLGFGLIVLYWLSGLQAFKFGGLYAEPWAPHQRVRLELVTLLCLIASLVTPYGTQLAAYPAEMTLFQPLNLQFIQEWMPLDLSQFYGKLFLGLVLLFWVLVIAKRPEIRLEDATLLLIAMAETFVHARFMLLFVPVFAPVLAELIAPWFSNYKAAKDPHVLNFVLMALIGFGIFKFFPSQARLQRQVAAQSPVGAVQFLQTHPGLQPTFNDYDWGGYLILTSAPAHQVFIDGRLDIYEYSGVMTDYLDIMHVQADTPFLLNKYHVRSCLIRPGSSLATLLTASPAWKQVYLDSQSVLFARISEAKPANRME